MHPKIIFAQLACIPAIALMLIIVTLPEGSALKAPLLGIQIGVVVAQIYCLVSAIRNNLF